MPGNLSRIANALTQSQEDTFKRLARTRRFAPKIATKKYETDVRVHPKIRWKRAYRKVRMMLLFSSDFTDLFEVRRESHRLGMNLVNDSLEDYLSVQEALEGEPSYEGWIAKLHPDNVRSSYVAEYDLGESDDDDKEIHGNTLNDLQKVAHKRRHSMCCVDFRFYSPESDHLKLWNSHSRVAEHLKIVVNIEEAETATIADGSTMVTNRSLTNRSTKSLTHSIDSDEEMVDELWEWSSEEEVATPGDSLKAFDLRSSALKLLKAYVAVLDVTKTDCKP